MVWRMKFKVSCFRLDFNPSFCISCTEVWNLLHYTFIFLALYFCISCTKFRFLSSVLVKWNIESKHETYNAYVSYYEMLINQSFMYKNETLKHEKSYHLRNNKLQFVEHNVACKIFAKLLLIVNLLSNK